ncbi:hypothetical protein AKJ52_02725 [candidate division MSBL1 archaeon SCGC-AAA382C18]|uniref:Aryldialkylphosphatase n=1 Tax=candidate division MSBL1 archaeon SCGC-AAA382C18 TaxID=1698281 RepID=A0A133VHU0_9EURY|nr:hypothetical protein AKJ52_02725 [candidate division MSBL1 archaeon SCGC-AAA382C18]
MASINPEDLGGNVLTVEGLVEPEELGITLPHEHLFVRNIESHEKFFEEISSVVERNFAERKMCSEIRARVHKNFPGIKDNLVIDNKETVIDEVKEFYKAGGDTILDATTIGLGRDPIAVREVSRSTNLNIIMGTGFYTEKNHPPFVANNTEKEIEEKIVEEITQGIDNTDIHAGCIGEIGLSNPIGKEEKKVLRATSTAAQKTGAPIHIHSSDYEDPSDIALEGLDILEEMGVDLNRVIVDHMDHLLAYENNINYQKLVAERGAYVEFDIFGVDWYEASLEYECPTDQQRIEAAIELIEKGFENKILFSHDICTKGQLKKYGGLGFDHLLLNIIPRLKRVGINEKTINKIFIENPKRVLQFR